MSTEDDFEKILEGGPQRDPPKDAFINLLNMFALFQHAFVQQQKTKFKNKP